MEQPSGLHQSRRRFLNHGAGLLTAALFSDVKLSAADSSAAKFRVLEPVPRQVYQRQGYRPAHAAFNAEQGGQIGFADLPLRLECPEGPPSRVEFRLEGGREPMTAADSWRVVEGTAEGNHWKGTVRIPAGGWYTLRLRFSNGMGQEMGTTSVEQVGVGEVFMVSGQSYAAGANDELQRIEDPALRVAAWEMQTHQWRIAHDPQPNVGEGGTIWPAFANCLLPIIDVPIGIVNVAVGGTSSREWLPGGKLLPRMIDAGRLVRPFRFVLWQQGESDVIERTSPQQYIANLQTIRRTLVDAWGFDPPWLMAKSTLHPTVYQRPKEEAQIRAAIDHFWKQPGHYPGPDTDLLRGENRGGPQSRRHFSPIGQRRAGLMWFAAVWQALQQFAATH